MRSATLALAAALVLSLGAGALALVPSVASGQGIAERSFETAGETLRYTLRTHPADAHRLDPAVQLAPGTPLDTARLLNEYLTAGKIEDAALLSNSPKRRYEVLKEYREELGDDEFRRVFAQYFLPQNRLAAEISIGEHTLLVWHLEQENRYAGLYFMQIEGRALMDDVPSEQRSQLRRLLEAYRSGELGVAPIGSLER